MSGLPAFGAQQPPRDPAALARAILTQSRFRVPVHSAPARTWWDALRDWLGARWSQLLQAFAHHVRVSPRASVAAGDVLLALAVGAVVLVGARLLLNAARASADPGSKGAPLALAANPEALHADAVRAAQSGAYRRAIALEFRAALAAMDARGVLRDDPARTVNECRRDVRLRASNLSAPFEALARAFTAAVYAEDRLTADAWLEAERAYAAFSAANADAA